MEIEIVTTKKKLTRALLLQMSRALSPQLMNTADVLGYIWDEKLGRIALLHSAGEYYTLSIGWKESGEITALRKNSSMTFANTEARDRWLEAHDRVQREALKTHIYI